MFVDDGWMLTSGGSMLGAEWARPIEATAKAEHHWPMTFVEGS